MSYDRDPARRRALAATERAWRLLETEFGLLDSAEVAGVLSRSEPNVTAEQIAVRRQSGQLLSTVRAGEVRYPGFQFDSDGRARLVVRPLRVAARQGQWSENGLILWMCAPCGRLGGRRPVDELDRPETVLAAAEASFAVSW